MSWWQRILIFVRGDKPVRYEPDDDPVVQRIVQSGDAVVRRRAQRRERKSERIRLLAEQLSDVGDDLFGNEREG